MATEKGLEPSTSGVTGRRSNRLNHSATAQLIYQKNRDLSTLFFRMVIFSSEEVFGSGKRAAEMGRSKGQGLPASLSVILSAAKDLAPGAWLLVQGTAIHPPAAPGSFVGFPSSG